MLSRTSSVLASALQAYANFAVQAAMFIHAAPIIGATIITQPTLTPRALANIISMVAEGVSNVVADIGSQIVPSNVFASSSLATGPGMFASRPAASASLISAAPSLSSSC